MNYQDNLCSWSFKPVMIHENVIEHLHHLVFENELSHNTFTASETKSPRLKNGLRNLHNRVNNRVLAEWSEFYPQSSTGG